MARAEWTSNSPNLRILNSLLRKNKVLAVRKYQYRTPINYHGPSGLVIVQVAVA